ncbi:hypothetical protein PV327_004499 [Microctonus hyperodae]|uniref:Uncharacterized protein n=1 Tax=Microctonus hyperodae TaxID=165561 RepID=A0AA39KMQ8_MICHY|nr:hypothetical protein PV327_004499 [Microctonus hyperodae]
METERRGKIYETLALASTTRARKYCVGVTENEDTGGLSAISLGEVCGCCRATYQPSHIHIDSSNIGALIVSRGALDKENRT